MNRKFGFMVEKRNDAADLFCRKAFGFTVLTVLEELLEIDARSAVLDIEDRDGYPFALNASYRKRRPSAEQSCLIFERHLFECKVNIHQ